MCTHATLVFPLNYDVDSGFISRKIHFNGQTLTDLPPGVYLRIISVHTKRNDDKNNYVTVDYELVYCKHFCHSLGICMTCYQK